MMHGGDALESTSTRNIDTCLPVSVQTLANLVVRARGEGDPEWRGQPWNPCVREVNVSPLTLFLQRGRMMEQVEVQLLAQLARMESSGRCAESRELISGLGHWWGDCGRGIGRR